MGVRALLSAIAQKASLAGEAHGQRRMVHRRAVVARDEQHRRVRARAVGAVARTGTGRGRRADPRRDGRDVADAIHRYLQARAAEVAA